jgi:hypothetical protein
LETGSACDFLPAPARSFDSAAGRALRYGSTELAALEPWPKRITVDALAGNATFNIPRVGWFALPWQTTSVPVGDLIVTADSALQGASLTKMISCSYQLNAVRGATDRIGLVLGQTSKVDVAEEPLPAFSDACFHTDLMRSIELTNTALSTINNDLSRRQNSPPEHWTDPQLTLTPSGLGAVKIGMSLQQAQIAAGVSFDGQGDGASYPPHLPSGYPHEFVNGGDKVTCVGAPGDVSSVQKVTTPEGLALGDPVARGRSIYGSAARFVPAANDGISPHAGYVITSSLGRFAVELDRSQRTVSGLVAGVDVSPTSCFG